MKKFFNYDKRRLSNSELKLELSICKKLLYSKYSLVIMLFITSVLFILLSCCLLKTLTLVTFTCFALIVISTIFIISNFVNLLRSIEQIIKCQLELNLIIENQVPYTKIYMKKDFRGVLKLFFEYSEINPLEIFIIKTNQNFVFYFFDECGQTKKKVAKNVANISLDNFLLLILSDDTRYYNLL